MSDDRLLLSTILREKGWTSPRRGPERRDRPAGPGPVRRDPHRPRHARDTGIDLLRAAKEIHPDVEVILMTGYATAETAIEAMRNGAFHYIMKPLKTEEV